MTFNLLRKPSSISCEVVPMDSRRVTAEDPVMRIRKLGIYIKYTYILIPATPLQGQERGTHERQHAATSEI